MQLQGKGLQWCKAVVRSNHRGVRWTSAERGPHCRMDDKHFHYKHEADHGNWPCLVFTVGSLRKSHIADKESKSFSILLLVRLDHKTSSYSSYHHSSVSDSCLRSKDMPTREYLNKTLSGWKSHALSWTSSRKFVYQTGDRAEPSQVRVKRYQAPDRVICSCWDKSQRQ